MKVKDILEVTKDHEKILVWRDNGNLDFECLYEEENSDINILTDALLSADVDYIELGAYDNIDVIIK